MMRKEANSESSFSFSLGFGNGCIDGSELREGSNDSVALVLEGAGAIEAGIVGGDNHCVEGGTGP